MNFNKPLRNRLTLIRTLWLYLLVLALIYFAFAAAMRYRELAQVTPTPVLDMLKFVVTPEAKYVPLQLAEADAAALAALGLSTEWYAAYVTLWEVLLIGGSLLVGVLVLWLRGDDVITGFSALSFILIGLYFAPATTAPARADPAWHLPVLSILMLASFCSITFCFIFPTGRFVPGWTRLIAALFALWVVAIFVSPAANPYNWPLVPFALYSIGLSMLLGFAQVYRYRHVSTPVQRQQTKWFVFGILATLVTTSVFNADLPGLLWPILKQPGLPHVVYNLVSIPLYFGVTLLPTLSISIAILRYRLWNIDIIIRRTLVYSVLTGLLALVYFGSVVQLQLLFRGLTGQEQSQFVTVLSTLMIAALFTPLRRRVQDSIDRRFYRRKYNTEQILTAFSVVARNEVDLERLSYSLVEVVAETMQPAHVSLWLRDSLRIGPRNRRQV